MSRSDPEADRVASLFFRCPRNLYGIIDQFPLIAEFLPGHHAEFLSGFM